MAKQTLELRIELSGTMDSYVESRKMDLLMQIAQAVKNVQINSKQNDGSAMVLIKSSFASNLDIFKDGLPNTLEEKTKEN